MAPRRWIPETLFDDLGFRMTYEVERVIREVQTEHQQLVLFERPPHQLAHRELLGLGPALEATPRALGQADGQHFFHMYDCVIHENRRQLGWFDSSVGSAMQPVASRCEHKGEFW